MAIVIEGSKKKNQWKNFMYVISYFAYKGLLINPWLQGKTNSS